MPMSSVNDDNNDLVVKVKSQSNRTVKIIQYINRFCFYSNIHTQFTRILTVRIYYVTTKSLDLGKLVECDIIRCDVPDNIFARPSANKQTYCTGIHVETIFCKNDTADAIVTTRDIRVHVMRTRLIDVIHVAIT